MVRKIFTLALSAAAIGCAAQQPWSFNLADFLMAKELPYDSPPQVIYRIDDHRFVTLEKYRDCNHGETWYNDTRAGIRSHLGRGLVENFQGRLINADPKGRNLVFPAATAPGTVCGDRGCDPMLAYSTDGGRTFRGMIYFEHSFDPYVDTRAYTVVADGSRVYVSEARQSKPYVVSYPLVPGYSYTGKDALPDGYEIKFDTAVPSGLRTPSGQDHITCDASITPTNPDAPLVRGRQ
ncbi:T6SS immunity protein Tli3 family protein [Burkholderia sp. WSM2232]|uniref:T6SS immunity protein Tli3 family protein n=1 Tax=Burkholderia sp. WSM2232 TaxID=944436 RepID=UPI00048350CA|nr:hypothetical protein [Burkholderia sp. WSM2232]